MERICPFCHVSLGNPRNPVPTVDIAIVSANMEIVLIERKNPPCGWALPGGFVDYGETVEQAAIREAKEETSLDVVLCKLIGVYSDPNRDPRMHTMSTVFLAKAKDLSCLNGADDAKRAELFLFDALPKKIAFDHRMIIYDIKNSLDQKKV